MLLRTERRIREELAAAPEEQREAGSNENHEQETRMQDIEQQIRERAYQLWAEGGCQDDRAEIHWLAAQREILSASLCEVARVSVNEPAKSAKPKAKRSQKKQRAA